MNDTSSIRFETLPVEPDPDNPNVTLVPSADADAVVEQLRTFGDNTPKPATVPPSQVKVRVTDATGTNVGQSVVSKLTELGFRATAASPAKKIPVTVVRYGFDQAEEAKALLPYFPDAKLVPDPKAGRPGRARPRVVVPRQHHGAVDHDDGGAQHGARRGGYDRPAHDDDDPGALGDRPLPLTGAGSRGSGPYTSQPCASW